MLILPPKAGFRKVGVMALGGLGCNTLKSFIEKYKPEDYPEFYFFGANTDADMMYMHFGERKSSNQEAWSSRVTLELLGQELTRGEGAGGDPEVGERAAREGKSLEAITNFIEGMDELILLTATAGGSGAGASIVAAEVAVDKKKSVQAIAIMPFPEDRRDAQAVAWLGKLQALVPTYVYENAYLQTYLDILGAGQPKSLQECWDIINELSIIPALLLLREIIQVPGDVKNLDRADKRRAMTVGNHPVLGVYHIPKDKRESITADEIVTGVTTLHFQNQAKVGVGKAIMTWTHGPLSFLLHSEVRKKLDDIVTAGSPERLATLQSHWGMVTKTSEKDDEMFVAMIVVASEAPVAPERPAQPPQAAIAEKSVSTEVSASEPVNGAPAAALVTESATSSKAPVSFTDEEEDALQALHIQWRQRYGKTDADQKIREEREKRLRAKEAALRNASRPTTLTARFLRRA